MTSTCKYLEPDFPTLSFIGLPLSAKSSDTKKHKIVIVLKKNLLFLRSIMTVDDTAKGLSSWFEKAIDE